MKGKLFASLCFAFASGAVAVTAQAPADSTKTTVTALSIETPTDTTGTKTLLSLDDCIEIALSSNPTVRVANMDIERVDYTRWEAVSQLLPQITFSGSYNRMLAKQVMYMNVDFGGLTGGGAGAGAGTGEDNGTDPTPASRASDKKDNGIKMGLDNSYQIGFSATLPVIAPQLWASLKLSDTQILEAVEKARASELDMINQVENAYYTLMLAYDSKKVLQQSYDMAAFTHDLYTKQQKLGAASDFDVLRTSVAMKNIEPQLMQADLAIKKAHLQLLLLMGLGPDFDFGIKGQLSDYEKTMYADVLSINRDLSNNTQLVQFDLQSQMVDQMLKVEKASLYPTLAAIGNYNWTSMSNGSPFKNFRWNPYSTVGLQLNVPIFTGGKRYARIKEAKIQVEEMRWNRENLENNLNMQFDLAIDNIKLNVQQIESSSENVKQATRAHDIMEQSFSIGAASYLNLRDSELALTQSQLAYLQAIYNYMVAQSQLKLLQGTAAPVNIPEKYRRYVHEQK